MGRPLRIDEGGLVYHVMNRAIDRARIFADRTDYVAFVRVLREALARVPMRILAFCLMPNHWHLILWPREAGDLSRFMQWMTLTHVQRWKKDHGKTGSGHLYQDRYKSIVVQDDEHYFRMFRYVERNALRANLVGHAEDWPWGSLFVRIQGSPKYRALLEEGPHLLPDNWTARVNEAETEGEFDALRDAIRRGRPYGPVSGTLPRKGT